MEVSKYYQDNNLIDICTDAVIHWESVLEDSEAVANCEAYGVSKSEIEDAVEGGYQLGINLADAEDMDLYDYIDWDWVDFDERLFVDILCFQQGYLQPDAYIYLVLGSCMGWQHLDGYKFADSVPDAMLQDYDCSIYLEISNFDGKVLTYTETSHDAPMGASMIIIALTEEEYDAITDDGYDDPNDDMIDKICIQGHLDPEDFERHDEEDVDDEYGEW